MKISFNHKNINFLDKKSPPDTLKFNYGKLAEKKLFEFQLLQYHTWDFNVHHEVHNSLGEALLVNFDEFTFRDNLFQNLVNQIHCIIIHQRL